MSITGFFVGLAAGTVLLYFGAEYLVKGGVILARKAGISTLVIGLTFVACATSAPELVVSISAALSGQPDISLGNIIGSNICNIALILGLCAAITPLRTASNLIRFDMPVMIVATVLLSGFYLWRHGIGRIEAGVFLLLFVAYTAWSIRQAKKDSAESPELEMEADGAIPKASAGWKHPVFFALLCACGGLTALIVGAKLFLYGAVGTARLLQLSEAVIGLTIVAVGTSLPELATSVVASLRGERDIAIGNVVGSNIFNILGILGITPLFMPISGASMSYVDLGMLLFCSIALLPIMKTGRIISRKEGIFLLSVYVGYTIWLVVTG